MPIRLRHPQGSTRSARPFPDATLPKTADETHGSTNLATIPRAGNISTDTRAGCRG